MKTIFNLIKLIFDLCKSNLFNLPLFYRISCLIDCLLERHKEQQNGKCKKMYINEKILPISLWTKNNIN